MPLACSSPSFSLLLLLLLLLLHVEMDSCQAPCSAAARIENRIMQREAVGLDLTGSADVEHDTNSNTHTHTHTYTRSAFLLQEAPTDRLSSVREECSLAPTSNRCGSKRMGEREEQTDSHYVDGSTLCVLYY